MKARNNLILLLTCTLLIALAFFFQSITIFPQQENSEPPWPSKRELRRTFWRAGKLLIVYATENRENTKAFVDYARAYNEAVSWLEVSAKPDTAVESADLTSGPVLLIGAQFQNNIIREIISGLPVQFHNGSFRFGEKFTSKPGDIFVLSHYPNPLARQMSISFIGGREDAAIREFLPKLKSRYSQSGEFRVFRQGQGILLGFFSQENQGPWRIDEQQSRFYDNHVQNRTETAHYRVKYHGSKVTKRALTQIADRQERMFQSMLDRLSEHLPDLAELPKITLHLYESPEDKGLMTGNTDLSHSDYRQWAVHAIYNDILQGNDFFADAQLISQKVLKRTESDALRDGLAMVFTENWSKSGYEFWAGRYFETNNVNPLSDLVNSALYSKESYLIMRPLAGTFVDFIAKKYGWRTFFKLYNVWPKAELPEVDLAGFSLRALEKDWRSYLANLQVKKQEPSSSDKTSLFPIFQKGVSYAHEGYQIYNGYLSNKSKASLTKLHDLGTEWISITPFGYLDNKNKPGYLHYSFGAGSENDESVVTALAHARQLKMGAMLKPHILLNNHNWGWPGDVEMKTEEDWQAFFKYYNSWIRHYAVLAEIYDFDIFCIGTELLHTTKNHQKEWRKIVRNIRSLYNGPLVYAANWWQEFDQITFWDELDYIGMNCYYPLSNSDSSATIENLKQGAEQFVRTLESAANKYNKPVLLTEVGFASTARSWQHPHEDGRDKPPYFDDQVKCYRAVFEILWDKPWFYGFYWWKWPTYLERGGMRHSSYTPNGKPAEMVLAEWYSKPWVRN